ncbi:disulfide bond formation protein DsbB [Pseudidiomarina sp. E22-M8]|uniref:disulfide bond formation protein DsbB n=1 Tax=Pseudidiomarina sp. E22-M8 TaxID=3424768 RepID=UPI00403D034E
MRFFAQLPERRGAWALLAATAFGLFATALYMQYQMGLEPCVKCIYQRVGVLGVGVAALVPLFAPKFVLARLLGFVGWLTAAIWGFIIADNHVAAQQAKNSFFAVCDTFPNFPGWMPLHQWLPEMFSATGLCGDINWSFLDMSMPEWMRIIFASYAIVGIVVLLLRLVGARKL